MTWDLDMVVKASKAELVDLLQAEHEFSKALTQRCEELEKPKPTEEIIKSLQFLHDYCKFQAEREEVHSGDCTQEAQTCLKCMWEQFTEDIEHASTRISAMEPVVEAALRIEEIPCSDDIIETLWAVLRIYQTEEAKAASDKGE